MRIKKFIYYCWAQQSIVPHPRVLKELKKK